LALDNPLNDPEGTLSFILVYMDIGLTSLFAIEALMKIIAFGLVYNGRKSYLRNYWNVLDILIVALSVPSLSFGNNSYRVVKIFRLLKILRPLRVISRNEGLRLSLHTLFIALPGIFNVMVVAVLFYLIFGIIGINYFKGNYFYCDTSNIYIDKSGINSI
jgi:hypothetical protein